MRRMTGRCPAIKLGRNVSDNNAFSEKLSRSASLERRRNVLPAAVRSSIGYVDSPAILQWVAARGLRSCSETARPVHEDLHTDASARAWCSKSMSSLRKTTFFKNYLCLQVCCLQAEDDCAKQEQCRAASAVLSVNRTILECSVIVESAFFSYMSSHFDHTARGMCGEHTTHCGVAVD